MAMLPRYTRRNGVQPLGTMATTRMIPPVEYLARSSGALRAAGQFAAAVTDTAYDQLRIIRQSEAERDAGSYVFERDGNGVPVMPDLGSEQTIYGQVYSRMMRQRYVDDTRISVASAMKSFHNEAQLDPSAFSEKSRAYLDAVLASVDPNVRGLVEVTGRAYQMEHLTAIEGRRSQVDWEAGAKLWQDNLTRLSAQAADRQAVGDPTAQDLTAQIQLQVDKGIELGYIGEADRVLVDRSYRMQAAYSSLNVETRNSDPGVGLAVAQALREGPGAQGWREEWAAFSPEERDWLANALDRNASNQAQLDAYGRARASEAEGQAVNGQLLDYERRLALGQQVTFPEVLRDSQRFENAYGADAARRILNGGMTAFEAQRDAAWNEFFSITDQKSGLGSLWDGLRSVVDGLIDPAELTSSQLQVLTAWQNGGGEYTVDRGTALDEWQGGNAWADATTEELVRYGRDLGFLPRSVVEMSRTVLANESLPEGGEAARALAAYRGVISSRAGRGNAETMYGDALSFYAALDRFTVGDVPTAKDWQDARDASRKAPITGVELASSYGYDTVKDFDGELLEMVQSSLLSSSPVVDLTPAGTVNEGLDRFFSWSGNKSAQFPVGLVAETATDAKRRAGSLAIGGGSPEALQLAVDQAVAQVMRGRQVSWTSIGPDMADGGAWVDGPAMIGKSLAFEAVAPIPGDTDGKWHRGFVAAAATALVTSGEVPEEMMNDVMKSDMAGTDTEAKLRHFRVAATGKLDANGKPEFQFYVNASGAWVATGEILDWSNAWKRELTPARRREAERMADRKMRLAQQYEEQQRLKVLGTPPMTTNINPGDVLLDPEAWR